MDRGTIVASNRKPRRIVVLRSDGEKGAEVGGEAIAREVRRVPLLPGKEANEEEARGKANRKPALPACLVLAAE